MWKALLFRIAESIYQTVAENQGEIREFLFGPRKIERLTGCGVVGCFRVGPQIEVEVNGKKVNRCDCPIHGTERPGDTK